MSKAFRTACGFLLVIILAGCFFEPVHPGEKGEYVPKAIFMNPPYPVSLSESVGAVVASSTNVGVIYSEYTTPSKIRIQRYNFDPVNGVFTPSTSEQVAADASSDVWLEAATSYDNCGYVIYKKVSDGKWYLQKSDPDLSNWQAYPSTTGNVIPFSFAPFEICEVHDMTFMNSGGNEYLFVVYTVFSGDTYKTVVEKFEIDTSITSKGYKELASSLTTYSHCRITTDGLYLYTNVAEQDYKKIDSDFNQYASFDGYAPPAYGMTDMWVSDGGMEWWDGNLVMASCDEIWYLSPNFEYIGETMMVDNADGCDPWDGMHLFIIDTTIGGGRLIALCHSAETPSDIYLVCLKYFNPET